MTNDVKLQTTTLYDNYCVRFFYHMYGADVGNLNVQIKTLHDNKVTDYFVRSRSQGDRWKEASFSVITDGFLRYNGYRVSFKLGSSVNHALKPCTVN